VEQWDRVLAVNLRGVFLCYKHAAKQMIAQGRGGRLIGASSLAGKKGHAQYSAYSASKFAVRGLTQSAALEYAKHGITVNAYAPGTIMTPMVQDIEDTLVKGTGMTPEQASQLTANIGAVGYKGTPEDIANLVSYLVSKEAHFVTGQSISCDGGAFFD